MKFKWVSVKDRLPEKSKEVFIRVKPDDCTEYYDLVDYSARWGKFNADDFQEPEYALTDVTHWADIPHVFGWIHVKEGLPEESGDYLVCTVHDHYAYVGYSKKYQRFNDYDHLPDDRTDAWLPGEDVVWWADIPKVPEEENDGI